MKNVFVWILGIVITLGAAVYQRTTGPTYEKTLEVSIEDVAYSFELPRSHGGINNCPIELTIDDQDISGNIYYRKYPTNNEWLAVPMTRTGNVLKGELPHQPPAGKLQYKTELLKNGQSYILNDGKPVVIRFKGAVPVAVLIPHILFIFFAMMLANVTGLMAVFGKKQYRIYTKITLFLLVLGGLIFGPWVQWYAFGEAWAGVPFGWDLTDNKTLIAFVFWLLALLVNIKKERPAYVVLASLVMLIIFAIPHSMFGSQLDPETGEIIQGWIRLF